MFSRTVGKVLEYGFQNERHKVRCHNGRLLAITETGSFKIFKIILYFIELKVFSTIEQSY